MIVSIFLGEFKIILFILDVKDLKWIKGLINLLCEIFFK